MSVERELKYSVLDPYVPDLMEVRAVLEDTPFDAEDEPTEEHTDHYYDDAQGSLRRAGWALRKRHVAGRALAGLKAAGALVPDGAGNRALHEREELEVPFEGTDDDEVWPEPIRERIAAIADPATLAERVELATTRVRFAIRRGPEDVALLSFDAVSARAPGSERSALFDEVEIEARGDAPLDDLEAIGEAVDRLVRLTPNPINKLERAEALLLLATW